MQQFILATFGSVGDVYPFLGLGAQLVRRGHQVTLVSFSDYAPAARSVGLDFVPIGSWSEVESQLTGVDVNDWRRMVKLLSGIMTSHMAETYYAIAERARPETKVVAFTTALGARFASERFGLPLATLHLAPAGIRSVRAAPRFGSAKLTPGIWQALAPFMYGLLDRVFDRELCEKVASFRSEVGLPALESVRRSMDSGDLTIGLFPEWFAPRQQDWPARACTSHFPLFDPGERRALTPQLAAFLAQGPAPIAFTAGSPTQGYGRFYQAAVAACTRLEQRGLLITRYDSDVPRDLPPTIAHVSYAPFSKLLPQVSALVHHGGIGTAAQALRAGVPQLLVPWGIDQFDNAKWLQQLGVARELSATSYSASKLSTVLSRMLSDADMLERCRSVAARFAGVQPLEMVCDKLEAFTLANARPRGQLEYLESLAERAAITQQVG